MSAQDPSFCDYYYILQVHQNAEPEIVKSAYRRLAQMYHPDFNRDPQATSKMQLINQAYAVVSDPQKRRAYHSDWLRHHQRQDGHHAAQEASPAHAAHQALDRYFRCLLQEDWKRAYEMLTVKDQGLIPLADFCAWKDAVKALCQMGSYVIKLFTSYDRCTVDETEYEKVCVFSVFVTDRDHRTRKMNEETYTKYIVLDRNDWRVCLGYRELKTVTYKLRYLATQAPEMDPSFVVADTLLKYDKLTGFYSFRGLRECVEKEVARAKRFRNQYSLAVFSILPDGKLPGITDSEYLYMCLSDFAAGLGKTLRSIDCAARFSDGQLAVLLIGTDRYSARKASDRLARVEKGEGLRYTVESSITAYQGESAEDTLIRASHDASMRITVDNGLSKKYRIRINEQQV